MIRGKSFAVDSEVNRVRAVDFEFAAVNKVQRDAVRSDFARRNLFKRYAREIYNVAVIRADNFIVAVTRRVEECILSTAADK